MTSLVYSDGLSTSLLLPAEDGEIHGNFASKSFPMQSVPANANGNLSMRYTALQSPAVDHMLGALAV